MPGQGKPELLPIPDAPDESPEAFVRAGLHMIWNRRSLAAMERVYHPGVRVQATGGADLRRDRPAALLRPVAAGDLPRRRPTAIDDLYWMGNPEEGFLVAIRWSLRGSHRGWGRYGAPTGREIGPLGHHALGDRGRPGHPRMDDVQRVRGAPADRGVGRDRGGAAAGPRPGAGARGLAVRGPGRRGRKQRRERIMRQITRAAALLGGRTRGRAGPRPKMRHRGGIGPHPLERLSGGAHRQRGGLGMRLGRRHRHGQRHHRAQEHPGPRAQHRPGRVHRGRRGQQLDRAAPER